MIGRATPKGRTEVLPDGWSQHHQPVAEGAQKGRLTIWSGPLQWVNASGGQETLHKGSLLATHVSFSLAQPEFAGAAGDQDNGAESTWVKEFMIAMPAGVQQLLQVGTLLEITDPGPAGMWSQDTPLGSVLVVLGPADGTERFEAAVRARHAAKGNLPQ